jgi:hypothetical protein
MKNIVTIKVNKIKILGSSTAGIAIIKLSDFSEFTTDLPAGKRKVIDI